MEIGEIKAGQALVVALKGRLDANSAGEVEEKLAGLLEQGLRKLVLDMTEVEYISSAGLRVLLSAAQKMNRLEGQLSLCALSQYVGEVFEISGFSSIFTITPSRQEALELLA